MRSQTVLSIYRPLVCRRSRVASFPTRRISFSPRAVPQVRSFHYHHNSKPVNSAPIAGPVSSSSPLNQKLHLDGKVNNNRLLNSQQNGLLKPQSVTFSSHQAGSASHHDHVWPSQIRQPVQWGDMDAFRHVNNALYLRYLESSRVNLFLQIAELGKKKSDPVLSKWHTGTGNFGPILKSIFVNYKFPVTWPDTLIVKTRVDMDSLGSDRFTMKGVAFSEKHNREVVSSDQVIVTIDYENGGKVPLTKEFIEILKELHSLT